MLGDVAGDNLCVSLVHRIMGCHLNQETGFEDACRRCGWAIYASPCLDLVTPERRAVSEAAVLHARLAAQQFDHLPDRHAGRETVMQGLPHITRHVILSVLIPCLSSQTCLSNQTVSYDMAINTGEKPRPSGGISPADSSPLPKTLSGDNIAFWLQTPDRCSCEAPWGSMNVNRK